MTLSLEKRLITAKEAPSPYEVRLTSLETNPVFQCLGEIFSYLLNVSHLIQLEFLSH